ncbi:MAG: cytochrome c-type biogenesis protein [Acidimicrobiia bacterium]
MTAPVSAPTRPKVARWVPWTVLALLAFVALAWAAWPEGDSGTPEARADALARELRCPDCEGLSVADSSTSTARAIRRDIEERTAAGESDGEIRQRYVDLYGESILLEPEGDRLGFLVWGLPVVAVVVGAAIVGAVVMRGRRGFT